MITAPNSFGKMAHSCLFQRERVKKNKERINVYLLRPRMLTRESKPNNSNFDSLCSPLTSRSFDIDSSLPPAPVVAFTLLAHSIQFSIY